MDDISKINKKLNITLPENEILDKCAWLMISRLLDEMKVNMQSIKENKKSIEKTDVQNMVEYLHKTLDLICRATINR